MDKFGASGDAGGGGNGRFASQAATAEDLLKAQTVGLVNLDDYRKRRAEAMEIKEFGGSAASSRAETPPAGYDLANTFDVRMLICQVQGIHTKTCLQEETQDSHQGQIIFWARRRRRDRLTRIESAYATREHTR